MRRNTHLKSERVNIDAGARQGGASSPNLFNLFKTITFIFNRNAHITIYTYDISVIVAYKFWNANVKN